MVNKTREKRKRAMGRGSFGGEFLSLAREPHNKAQPRPEGESPGDFVRGRPAEEIRGSNDGWDENGRRPRPSAGAGHLRPWYGNKAGRGNALPSPFHSLSTRRSFYSTGRMRREKGKKGNGKKKTIPGKRCVGYSPTPPL